VYTRRKEMREREGVDDEDDEESTNPRGYGSPLFFSFFVVVVQSPFPYFLDICYRTHQPTVQRKKTKEGGEAKEGRVSLPVDGVSLSRVQ
jgi:hypothetical protein